MCFEYKRTGLQKKHKMKQDYEEKYIILNVKYGSSNLYIKKIVAIA